MDISNEELEWLEEPIRMELEKLGTKYNSDMVKQISRHTKYFYEHPNLMLTLPDDQRAIYQEFVNILAENMKNRQPSASIIQRILQDNINGQRGFLNIIFLSLVMIMLVMLVIYIMN